MPTITNRSPLSKGYKRDRAELSRRLHCTRLGKMTQEDFKAYCESEQHTFLGEVAYSIVYQNNKATINFKNNMMLRFSYEPIDVILTQVNKELALAS